ncbi:unnamed protein product [Schistocephalus solidus]|uniref:Anticodon_1 domain-containing protein n=1 Tax=Schistocephalus solidus TaxID=70667 RepID=A0A183SCL3_SCHSO|nr:unnamed protein product [Schistocephalus solidus]
MLYPLSPAFACELWEGYRMALSLAPPLLEAALRRHSAWPYDLVAGPTSALYLRALADLLVMLYPLSPAFACELWEGYRMALSLAPPLLEAALRRHSAWPYDLVSFLSVFPPHLAFCCSIHYAVQSILLHCLS